MTFNFLNGKSSIFAAANPFAVSEFVRENVGPHRLTLARPGSDSASLSHRKAGKLDLCRLSYGSEARVVSECLGDIYHVQLILQGICRYNLPHHALELGAGQLMVINPDEPLDLTYSENCEKFIVKIPSSLMEEVCTEHSWIKPYKGVKFSPVPYRFDELENLMMLLSLVCNEAESDHAGPEMLRHYSKLVTCKLMTMLKHNVAMASATCHTPSFERLVRYIEDNIKHDITAERLAQYAGLSLRSLYLLFEKNVRMTPKNFIRQKKLEHVYATLMDPASRVANVTAVALEYGFTHLGRFAELYKTSFGVLPSETLKIRQTSKEG